MGRVGVRLWEPQQELKAVPLTFMLISCQMALSLPQHEGEEYETLVPPEKVRCHLLEVGQRHKHRYPGLGLPTILCSYLHGFPLGGLCVKE